MSNFWGLGQRSHFKKFGIRNNRIFVYIFILKKLIKDREVWMNFLIILQKIIKKYQFVKLSNLGFPSNWEDLLSM